MLKRNLSLENYNLPTDVLKSKVISLYITQFKNLSITEYNHNPFIFHINFRPLTNWLTHSYLAAWLSKLSKRTLTSSGALPSRERLFLQGPRQSWQTLVVMTSRQSEQKMVPQLVMLKPVLTRSADFLQMLQCSHSGLMVQVWLVTWLRSCYLTLF